MNTVIYILPTVRRVAKRFGMRVVNDDEEWTIYWTDMALPDKVCEMKSYQVYGNDHLLHLSSSSSPFIH